MSGPNSNESPSQPGRVRIDKWLWAARFFKTRAQAKLAIEGGKVHCDGNRAKPSKELEIGSMVVVRQGFDEKTVLVKGLSDQRRGAAEAQRLYTETDASIKQREHKAAERRTQPSQWQSPGKPNKKQQRLIQRFKRNPEY